MRSSVLIRGMCLTAYSALALLGHGGLHWIAQGGATGCCRPILCLSTASSDEATAEQPAATCHGVHAGCRGHHAAATVAQIETSPAPLLGGRVSLPRHGPECSICKHLARPVLMAEPVALTSRLSERGRAVRLQVVAVPRGVDSCRSIRGPPQA